MIICVCVARICYIREVKPSSYQPKNGRVALADMLASGPMSSMLCFFPVLLLFGAMAPKAATKAKAKAQSKPTAKALGVLKDIEKKDEQPEKSKKTPKEKLDVKVEDGGKLPAIPPAELNKMNADLRYRATLTGNNEEVQEFVKASRDSKRDFYWNRWKLDRKSSFITRTETRTKDAEQVKTTLVGKVTKFKVAELNGILPGVPNYDDLCNELVKDLTSEPHPTLGDKLMLYEYNHDLMARVEQRDKRSSGITMQSDLSKGQEKAVMDWMFTEKDGTCASSPTDPEWLVSYKEILDSAIKMLHVAEKQLEMAHDMKFELSQKTDDKLASLLLEELVAKIEAYKAAKSDYNEAIMDKPHADETQTEESAKEITNAINEFRSNIYEPFKGYLRRVKNFVK